MNMHLGDVIEASVTEQSAASKRSTKILLEFSHVAYTAIGRWLRSMRSLLACAFVRIHGEMRDALNDQS
jgi:hypothetical protein